MPNVNCRPADAAWITPFLTVHDADVAIAFYQKAFGFELVQANKDADGRTTYASMRWKDAKFMLGREGYFGGPAQSPKVAGVATPVTLYVYCEDVDLMFERARAGSASVVQAPEDMFWEDRVCIVLDADGHRWAFATHLGPRGE